MQYVFANCELDTQHGVLRNGTKQGKLGHKLLQVLHYLLDHADRIVTRQELAEQFWAEQDGNDTAILRTIRSLWIAVGDNSRKPGIIKPHANLGYRIAVPVTVVKENADRVPQSADGVCPDEAVKTLPDRASQSRLTPVAPPAVRLHDKTVRRQLTALFCDLVIAPLRATRLEPEDHVEVVQACHDACTVAMASYEGYLVQHLGDGFLAYFGYPQAHEDSAQRAVYSALDMLDAIALLNDQLPSSYGVAVTAQIGIHTGVIVANTQWSGAEGEPQVIGELPTTAMRLPEQLAPNTIGISSATYDLVCGYVSCQAIRGQTLRGLPEPIDLYQVLGKPQTLSRFEANISTRNLLPMVGRESELELLLGQWKQVRESLGAGVCISGEAGMGKSRLLQALKDQVDVQSEMLLECQGSPYDQRTAFWPLIGVLEQLCEWEPHERPDMKVKKLETLLSQFMLPRGETLALFANLLSLTVGDGEEALRQMRPWQRRQRLMDAFLTMFLELADQRPVLFVLEDVQWADASTLDFLDLLVDQAPHAQMLVLLTFRSDFQLPLKTRSSLIHLQLGALTNQQVEEMILHLTDGKAIPAELLQQLVAKTDGLPLFVEEMTHMIMRSGSVQERRGGDGLGLNLSALTIPSTLQDSLVARLDQLERGQETAQWAAVIGREFSYGMLHAAIRGNESKLQKDLLQLVEADLLQPRGAPPQSHYRFKHALIQDIAYQTLPRHARRHCHQQIAQALEQGFPETCTTQPERLAHHYAEAGGSQKAAYYWHQAAHQALDRTALTDAASHAQQGLAALSELPEDEAHRQQELDFQLVLCKASYKAARFGQLTQSQAYRRAYELSEEIGNVAQRFELLGGLGHWYLMRAELAAANEIGEQLLALARRENDAVLLRKAHRDVATSLFFLGDLVPARKHIQLALPERVAQLPAGLTAQHTQLAETALLRYRAWNEHLLGYPDQALTIIEQGMKLSQHSMISLGLDLFFKLVLHQWRGEPDAIDMQVEPVIGLAQKNPLPILEARAWILSGWSVAQRGEPGAGLNLIHRGIADYRATGSETFLTYFMALLADVYSQAGDIASGLRTLSEAMTFVSKTGERCWEAELYRLQAELLLRQSSANATEAENALHQALRVARQQQAKMLELRATTSLCRLWRQLGKRQPALTLLQTIYDGFTEGYETADLKDARACLDALA